MHRVNRDPADAEILVEVLVGRDVAAAALDPHLHHQFAAVGDRRDVGIRLENFDIRVGLDVTRPHFTRLGDVQIQRLHRIAVHLQGHLLDVQDDVGRVFDDAGDR